MIRFTVLLHFLVYVYLGTLATFGVAGNEEKLVTVKDSFRLPSDDLIPFVGFGTYQVKGDDLIFKLLDYALKAGYRLIDSAQYYENEESIGKALKVLLPKYNLTRKDIFITTKLHSAKLGGDDVYQTIEKSVKNLGYDYVDLFLIHFPGLYFRNNTTNPKNDSVLRDETWQVMVRAVKAGFVRNIGVSNYLVHHLKELLGNDHGIKPGVNQLEWHPGYHPAGLLELCRQEGILLQAYGSLGGTGRADVLLQRPEVVKIADKLKKTPAQILLRWALQQKIGIIPKASSEDRIKQNVDLDFIIPEEDMRTLLSFEQKHDSWNAEHIQ